MYNAQCMYNAKFDRYCLNDIELLAHRRRRRRDAINTMELFVFRGSRARSPPPLLHPSSSPLLPAIAIAAAAAARLSRSLCAASNSISSYFSA